MFLSVVFPYGAGSEKSENSESVFSSVRVSSEGWVQGRAGLEAFAVVSVRMLLGKAALVRPCNCLGLAHHALPSEFFGEHNSFYYPARINKHRCEECCPSYIHAKLLMRLLYDLC